jgi:hypothetical protein
VNNKTAKPVVLALAGASIVSGAFAWRDLSRRPDERVRGPKRAWRVFITMNPGNSIFYWLFGRR